MCLDTCSGCGCLRRLRIGRRQFLCACATGREPRGAVDRTRTMIAREKRGIGPNDTRVCGVQRAHDVARPPPRFPLSGSAAILVGSLLALTACGAAADEPSSEPGTTSEAIVGGEADTGDPAVVALVGSDGKEQCTATLIATDTLLTAGHCGGATAVFGTSIAASRKILVKS